MNNCDVTENGLGVWTIGNIFLRFLKIPDDERRRLMWSGWINRSILLRYGHYTFHVKAGTIIWAASLQGWHVAAGSVCPFQSNNNRRLLRCVHEWHLPPVTECRQRCGSNGWLTGRFGSNRSGFYHAAGFVNVTHDTSTGSAPRQSETRGLSGVVIHDSVHLFNWLNDNVDGTPSLSRNTRLIILLPSIRR